MADCELCGAMKVSVRQVLMGRANVSACMRCIEKLGLEPKKTAPGLKMAGSKNNFTPKPRRKNDIMAKSEKELSPNFASIISQARKEKGWNHSELGKRMAETVNIIKAAESGKTPTDSVVKKFERVLGITLMVESKPEETKRIVSDGSRKMTLGDYFKQNGA